MYIIKETPTLLSLILQKSGNLAKQKSRQHHPKTALKSLANKTMKDNTKPIDTHSLKGDLALPLPEKNSKGDEWVNKTSKAAQKAGHLFAQLERQGQPIGLRDTFIAAIAITRRYNVATRNHQHFNRIPGLDLIIS